MHSQFLLAALEQARLGRGFCAPNPAVGAVAMQNDIIIAQASHCGSGTPHAECLLFEMFPEATPDVTLYVTLEPCNHWGKTPPCVDAIIRHGIRRVVFAYSDPNPVVASNGTPDILRAHGIDVIHHPIADIDLFYRSYRHWVLTKKPWVTVKMAQSLDGKIAGIDGLRVQLSNQRCGIFTHQLRLGTDAILTTARTIEADNPQLNARIADKVYAKPIAILDRNLDLTGQETVFKTAKQCHVFYDETNTKSKNAEVLYHATPLVAGKLDLAFVISRLGQLGFHDVLVEAGGQLFASLHQQHLVNQTYLYITPKVLGAHALAMYREVTEFPHDVNVTWTAMGDNMMASFLW